MNETIIIENLSENYPQSLKELKKSPKKLYAKGNLELLKKYAISVIGTRRPTEYGIRTAKKFVKDLNLYNFTIISGMAEGIDTIAHSTALENLGNTIAVLPCGFKYIYPKSNEKLYMKILENNGLVITEYREDEEAKSEYFLERNRIVAALSIGTLVVEGGYRSGTGITARIAQKLKRKVFCIPSSLENKKGITPNKLIKEGAKLVTNVEDIICEYPKLNIQKDKTKINKQHFKQVVSRELQEIYNILSYEEAIHINQIARKINRPINEISSKLMLLELENRIVSLPGNIYKKK